MFYRDRRDIVTKAHLAIGMGREAFFLFYRAHYRQKTICIGVGSEGIGDNYCDLKDTVNYSDAQISLSVTIISTVEVCQAAIET